MLVTYTIRTYVTDLSTVGQVHGDLYMVATVGSVVGVFTTSYLLIPTFTVTHIFYGLGVAVLLFGLIQSRLALKEVELSK
jgi:CBS-domain-containing membrane protein